MTTYSPAVNTYTAIETITLTAATSQVSFYDLPQTYRDLILVVEASTTETGVTFDIQLNGDTGSNYTAVEMGGRNNGTYSATNSDAFFRILGNTFNTTPFQTTMQLMDYSATDKHKTALVRASSYDASLSSYLVKAYAARWANTSAVTSISLYSLYNSRSFAIGSTFSIYGIKA
jgi:hypothetical protein